MASRCSQVKASIAETCKAWRCRFGAPPPACFANSTAYSFHRLSTARTGAASRPLELQRQRNQFVVAGHDVGEHEILDNSKIVPPANHVRRQALRRLRVDRGNVDADQPRAAQRQALHGFRRQRAEAGRPGQFVSPVHQFEKQPRRRAVEGGRDLLDSHREGPLPRASMTLAGPMKSPRSSMSILAPAGS